MLCYYVKYIVLLYILTHLVFLDQILYHFPTTIITVQII